MPITAVFDLNSVAQISAKGIVDCLIEGTLIAIFAGCVLRVTRQSAAVRFAARFSTLAMIAALPFLGNVETVQSQVRIAVHPPFALPASWAVYLFSAWAIVAAVGLGRVGMGLLHLYRLRKSCTPLDPSELDSMLRETLVRCGARRGVAFCVSARVSVPTAIGFAKPVVVIPCWLMQELSTDELNQVLLHELAHLRRRDDWSNLFQKIVKALFFFHPAVWWIEKNMSLEREMACDDAVLAETAKPRAYAECLAHLAERSFIRRTVALAQAALGHIRQTSLRVAQILEPDRPIVSRRNWKPAAGLMAGLTLVCAVLVLKTPRLIAFEDNSAQNVARAQPSSLSLAPTPLPATIEPATAEVHPAQFVVPSGRSHPVRAKAKPTPAISTNDNYLAAASASQPPAPAPAVLETAEDLVHLTGLHDASAAPETVFVVVQRCDFNDEGQPTYQLSVWRITVTPDVQAQPGNRVLPKKT